MDNRKVVRAVWATLLLLSMGLVSLSFYNVRPQFLDPKPSMINFTFDMTSPIPPSVKEARVATVTPRDPVDSCTSSSYVSFQPEGRLGNRVCEYIHLFHFHLVNSVNAVVHPEMWSSLHDMFPHISLKTLSAECLGKLSSHKVVYKSIMFNLTNGDSRQTLLIGTPCKPTVVWGARNHWRKELVFGPDFQSNATARTAILVDKWQQQQQVQTNESSAPPAAPTVVGVHVRRGDYQELLDRYSNKGLLPASYYHRAFQHYRQRFDRPVFLVLTEPAERDWCRKQLAENTSDVIVVDDSASAEQDLALLASTEHIIYSHGTFGLMGILLSQVKTVVYPAVSAETNTKRYALHAELDIVSENWTSVEFVTISSDENE